MQRIKQNNKSYYETVRPVIVAGKEPECIPELGEYHWQQPYGKENGK